MARIPVYSTLLHSLSGFVGEAAFLVPAGQIVVVRDIDVVVGISAGVLVWAYDTSGAQFWAKDFGVTTAGKTWDGWRGRQVIPGPGFFYISTDAACDVRASGYLLPAN